MTQSIHEFATESSHAQEAKQKKDEKTTVWVFVWTLFVFKVVTIGAILWASGGTGEAKILLAATSWLWVGIPIFAVAGPIAFLVRRRRVRRRRKELQRAEWMLNEATSSESGGGLASTAAWTDNSAEHRVRE
jgi:hypothetical protein